MGYIIYDEDSKPHAEATSQQAGRRHDLEILAFRDAEPRLDRRPLVKGVLQHQQASMVVGETGCGKTFLALDLSPHVAAGLEWFGRKVDQGAVVYLAAKADRGIVDRIAAFKYAHSLQDKDLLFVAVTSPIDLWNAGVGNVDRISEAISEVALGKTVFY